MIDHTGINVSSFVISKAFYETVLAMLGYTLRLGLKKAAGFGDGNGADPGGDFWISEGTPFTPRSHIAFHARNEAEVNAFFEAALAAGGKSNGAPGIRPHYHASYYATFVHDPDGYNIEAVFHGNGAPSHPPEI
ncbi:MAG: glyoxalase [Candidatus Dactylopiibacterium carminicum]|uniref:Glyoxalase n=1 Tax=Candidatus Dactylopiibacterium carminicum TaxID=857335 RepID=A0A272EX35_9RHOO|nr:VOC family protein [Candidatus Dactylopiibacterium carminicum]KAF7600274.1 VOC family protein [Candidatus Dactylopiibacterium carminicum]PAS94674.1 MAG: glyoxalase [Candidatus Dactylopiibacterium carminicum]PAS96961.1 MAG: glyoxalase [Candidatus Dactylopiibacterium carminicum]PAT00273.1 MAG: glyoxalase [Candidatus Dactylopiibacterium carminicum]